MKVWAVSNQKGGVGKTTTVVSLSGLLVKAGYRVLMIDMDPHGSLSAYFKFNSDENNASIYELFIEQNNPQTTIKSLIKTTGIEHLDLIAASATLVTMEKRMGNREGMGRILQQGLKGVVRDYDFVLIDTPPLLGVLLINALAASDQVLIPVQTEFLALKGLERMMNTLNMLNKSLGRSLSYTIIPTMFDRRTHASIDTLRALRLRFENAVWPSFVPIDTKFRDASKSGIPPAYYMPDSRGLVAYAALLKYLKPYYVAQADEIPA
ncbi:MAG TPA: ParA family protein [Pseudomonadales bacterium]|nr:ParA family protein [Pseudomonadales bacterium]